MANLPNSQKPFEALQAALAGQYEVRSLDVHDFPLFLAFASPLSEQETGRKPRLPAGRGLTRSEALIGAAAEAIELRASLAHNVPDGLHRLSKIGGHDHLQAKSLIMDDSLAFPAQHVFLDYAACKGETLVFEADSTGCAAGTTLASAYQRGLLECIERDAVASWWYGRQRKPVLPLALLDPIAPRVAWWLSCRPRETLLYDLTSDVRVPSIAAVSSDTNGLNVAIGSAAALSTTEAALSAVLEMLQTEVTMEFGRGGNDQELALWRKRASTKTMQQFEPADEHAKPFQITAQQLLKAVSSSGHNAYGVELTLPGDPLPSVRVLVPGFSALNRHINAERIAKASGFSGTGNYAFELLEPF